MAPIQRAPEEVRRVLTRLAFEYTAAGWTYWTLGRESGVHPSVLKRWETGQVTNPLVSLLAAAAEPLGLRVDLVAERHLPLLELDEFEVEALAEAALTGWSETNPGWPREEHLRSALVKLGKIKQEASEHA